MIQENSKTDAPLTRLTPGLTVVNAEICALEVRLTMVGLVNELHGSVSHAAGWRSAKAKLVDLSRTVGHFNTKASLHRVQWLLVVLRVAVQLAREPVVQYTTSTGSVNEDFNLLDAICFDNNGKDRCEVPS